MNTSLLSRKHTILLVVIAVWAVHFYFLLPNNLFQVSYSKILFSAEKQILSVKIADDEQWRLPLTDSLSDKYKTCLIQFEDESFYNHFGVNPLSLFRATYQNLTKGYVKSGGSTITMQVIRMSKKNPPRTVWEKLKEIYLSIRLELSFNKEEILKLYAGHAPFGGNIVGITAAGWKYFGRPLNELSWAEAATLAVLPNSPSLIFPGKNNHLLKIKRDFLLAKLHKNNIIDAQTLSLSKEEPLPTRFLDFPRNAPHALEHLVQQHPQQNIFQSTLNKKLQLQSNQLLNHYISEYAHNHIYNGAILIIDNYTNEVVSYIGNSEPLKGNFHENYVDLIQAPRSTGSILKPFLHASALDEGLIMSQSLLPDIPTIIQGFAPQNYTKTYEGAVKANVALARSLNIPAVRLLQQYGYPKFHSKLKQLGMTTINNEADHYGLALILGGAEATLWDLVKMYSGMATTLNKFEKAPLNKPYSTSYFDEPLLIKEKTTSAPIYTQYPILSASATFETFEALLELKRPTEEGSWKLFENSKKIAWKTGTSHGFRDAWAVGVTPHYTVGVWVGNATGEGRPDLIGVQMAAPILFSVYNLLPNEGWFSAPKREMYQQQICLKSGLKAGLDCFEVDTVLTTNSSKQAGICPYCKRVFLNEKGLRVNSSCYDVAKMHKKHFFVLPPVEEWYYLQKSANYQKLPQFASECEHHETDSPIGFIYPHPNAKLYIPRLLEGERGQLICQATHKNKQMQLYWHLDELYLGVTSDIHHMTIDYKKGKHTITILDEEGNKKSIAFEIL